MPDREQLLSLAERVEASAGPDREVDYAIWQIADPTTSGQAFWNQRCCVNRDFTDEKKDAIAHARAIISTPPYTASLDAAMTLVPEGCDWTLIADGWAQVQHDVQPPAPTFEARVGCAPRAIAPALALTAACLRALADVSADHAR